MVLIYSLLAIPYSLLAIPYRQGPARQPRQTGTEAIPPKAARQRSSKAGTQGNRQQGEGNTRQGMPGQREKSHAYAYTYIYIHICYTNLNTHHTHIIHMLMIMKVVMTFTDSFCDLCLFEQVYESHLSLRTPS